MLATFTRPFYTSNSTEVSLLQQQNASFENIFKSDSAY